MSDSIEQHSADELTPTLRKALVELGAAIPTSPQEVNLAEPQPISEPSHSEIGAAFAAVLHALDDSRSSKPFIQLDEAVVFAADNELAMPARNGGELDGPYSRRLSTTWHRPPGSLRKLETEAPAFTRSGDSRTEQ